MIEARHLTKHYGRTVAVDDLSFTVPAGTVTGFVGPNGAGKSTTMRMILGLDRASAGTVTVYGDQYRDLPHPLRRVGALLDASALHPNRRGRDHLRALALSNELPPRRVDEVLDQVGLTSAALRRAGSYSLGMRQRLGIAAALLGDPPVLLLDEPVNGLDPEGVTWIRQLLRALAAQGRTILLSSHLMSEMALTADRLIVIGRGRLLADTTVDDLVASTAGHHVDVRTPQPDTMAGLLTDQGAGVTTEAGGTLHVTGLPAEVIGQLAASHQLPLTELATRSGTLEDAYLQLTESAVDYRTAATTRSTP
jgi:ABC-2 type transport system ATP-binding protein